MNWFAIWFAMFHAVNDARNEGKIDFPYPDSRIVKLSISPAALPKDTGMFELTPTRVGGRDGNRVVTYLQAGLMLPDRLETDDLRFRQAERRGEWSCSCPDQLLADALETDLKLAQKAVRHFRTAKEFGHVDWQETRPRRIDSDPHERDYYFKIREVIELAALTVKLDLLRSRIDQAYQTIQSLFLTGKDLSTRTTLVNYLSANAVTMTAQSALIDWVSRPDTQNVYSTLAKRRRPFLEMAQVFVGDREILKGEYEWYKRESNTALTPDAVQDFTTRYRKRLGYEVLSMDFLLGISNPEHVWDEIWLWHVDWQNAKREIAKRGLPLAKARNPGFLVYDAAWLRTIDRFEEIGTHFQLQLSDLLKALQRVERQDQEIRQRASEDRVYRQLWIFHGSAYQKLGQVIANCERQFDLLQAVEAIRLHAALTGTWPEKMSEIVCVPVPPDPGTGKPFEFKRTANNITLDAPPPIAGEMPNRGNSIRFELTLRPIDRRP